MGKKSKRRGGGKLKETQQAFGGRSSFAASLGVTGETAEFFEQVVASNPPEEIFRQHKMLVTKRLKVAMDVGAFDEYRFVFDRLFYRATVAAESIDALPDRVSSIDDDVFEILKDSSHDFIHSPICNEVQNHSHFTTLATWCKIAMTICHFDVHLGSTEAIAPLFDKDAADLLRRVSSDDEEPMPLRTMAMVARATIMLRNCNGLNEASYRRRALSYFAQIRDSDYPLVSGTEGVIGDLLSAAMGIATPDYLSFFSSVVTGIVSMSNDRLKEMEGPSHLPEFLGDLDSMSAEQMGDIASFASSVGGAFCDHCRASREDASVFNFFKCANCRLAHYCSKDCQRKAWDAGHNKNCKKNGSFDIGDPVVFEGGVKGRRHVNVVEIIKGGSTLKCDFGPEGFAMARKKVLRHTRPPF